MERSLYRIITRTVLAHAFGGMFLFVFCCTFFATGLSFGQQTTDTSMANIYPVFGNPNGDVTIFEFYDYQCGYCKASEEGLERLLREDKNLKIIYMDFPKLGPLSDTAAIATLASLRQGADKYLKLHNMLMNKNVRLTGEDMLYQTAASVGLDVGQIKKDMTDPAIAQQVRDNIAAGKSAGVRVTPSFVIGGQFFPGYATYDELKQRVGDARAAK